MMHVFYIVVGLLALAVLFMALAYTRKQFIGNKELVEHFRKDPNSLLATTPAQQQQTVTTTPAQRSKPAA